MSDLQTGEARVSGTVREAWDGGGIVDAFLTAAQPINGWVLTVDVGGEIINIWNARILSREGTVYALGPMDYNTQVPAGKTIDLGFQVVGDAGFLPTGLDAVLAADVARDVAPPPVAAAVPVPTPAPPTNAEGQDEPALAARARVAPEGGALSAAAPLATGSVRFREGQGDPFGGLFVEGGTQPEPPGSGFGLPADSFAKGPLFTDGATIIDSAGERAEIHGINWFGFETEIFVPHGLWARNWRAIMDEVKSLGFNTLRVPFSGELVASNGGAPSGIDFTLNPDLQGLSGLEVLDKVVAYADTIGLRILLDYHRGNPGGGPNDNGLWFGDGRTEADVIAEWRTMAERYRDDPAVIGADLINEPHMGTWGDGSATDWAAAAERIGAAVQAIAPHWLIVVEGISSYEGRDYWWGGNLQGVRDRPVELPIPNKLVYSPHDYPASVHAQDWFFDGTDLVEKFRENWGFIAEEGIAPVLLGEWGSRLETDVDRRWAHDLSDYLALHNIAWLWWSLNPNSGDTGGVLEDDWTTVRTDVTGLLAPFLQQTRPTISFEDAAARETPLDFVIRLPEPSQDSLVLKYATTDGTATAGEDYVATSGTLLFSPGEIEKVVSVPVLPDLVAEGDEFFYLVLGGAGSATASGTGVIADDERPATRVPFVDVASTVVGGQADAAQFRVVLSEPSLREVRVNFTAQKEGGGATTDGTLLIPPGAREATLEVSIEGGVSDATSRYVLTVTGAVGAQIRTSNAVGTVAANPPGAAEIALSDPATADPKLTVDIVLENDWGTGALFNIVIKNVSTDPVEAWQLALDLPFDLAELWSAVLVSDEGARVTVRNADWNGAILPGETVDFGFIATDGSIELSEMVAAAGVSLAVE